MGDHALSDTGAAHATWTAVEWEAAWAAYDETTYRAALSFIHADDVVLDIGAGDLRFARRAASRAHAVIAIEQRAELLAGPFSSKLVVVPGDARVIPFPPGITVGVLLMRHCRHFAEYAAKLRAAGCRRLITNARWGMAVECISLAPQPPFAAIALGWYACVCGAVGFKPGLPESLTASILAGAADVENCPTCLEAEIRD